MRSFQQNIQKQYSNNNNFTCGRTMLIMQFKILIFDYLSILNVNYLNSA